MDIFAFTTVAAATAAPGLGYPAAGKAARDRLADHRSAYYPQRARLAPWRTVPHRIDNDGNPRYLVALREKKAA
ncbi:MULTISPECIES: hypothetical protein [unclassified Bradyrhizobium]|uniref:hypothetical protein n=1 Tax=unclassified Bradyrhizobium TaxID=2631580 RepID=UPI0028E6338A|nr:MULTISPECIES: hypothetical protein [unclassified Bradyrhizobium]